MGIHENPGDFPEWLLFEVLVRVPFESLRALKLVSKQWNRTISDRSFARAYVHRFSSRTQRWSLISGSARKVSRADLLSGNKPGTRGVNLGLITGRNREDRSPSGRVVLGSSDGLLLYGHRSEDAFRHEVLSYEICNPVTGQSQRITTVPPPRHDNDVVATGFVTRIEQDVLKSFRVVRANVHQENTGSTMFGVYSSETRAWEYHTIHDKIDFFTSRNPVVIGKTLHWMILGHRVAAYDPYDKPGSVRFFRLPSHDGAINAQRRTTEYDMVNALLDQHEGHLRLAEAKLVGRCDNRQWIDFSVWVLNDYDSGMWSLQRRVRVDGLSRFSIPVCFNPFDPNVVYVVNGMGFFSYDFGTGMLRIEVDSKRGCDNLIPYSLSAHFLFVTPPCPLLGDPLVPSYLEM